MSSGKFADFTVAILGLKLLMGIHTHIIAVARRYQLFKDNKADVKMRTLKKHNSVHNPVKFGTFFALKTLIQMLKRDLKQHDGH